MKRPPSASKSPPKRRGAKKATTISVQSEKHISAICTRFQLEEPILTFRDVQSALNRKYGLALSVGTVWHLAHGREPKADDIRAALGLPVTVSIAVCPRHGVVHKGRCPVKRTFEENAAEYDRWRAANAGRIAAILKEVVK